MDKSLAVCAVGLALVAIYLVVLVFEPVPAIILGFIFAAVAFLGILWWALDKMRGSQLP